MSDTTPIANDVETVAPTAEPAAEPKEFVDFDDELDEGVGVTEHVHGPDCDHDHDHVHGPDCDHDHGYDPVNPDTDSILPADMDDEQKKYLEMLQNMNPEQLQQFASMMAMRNQMQDPEERRKILKRRLREKQMQHRYQRANKQEKQRMVDKYARERAEFEAAQKQKQPGVGDEDNVDALVRDAEVGNDVEDLDGDVDDVDDLDNLPSMGAGQIPTATVEPTADTTADATAEETTDATAEAATEKTDDLPKKKQLVKAQRRGGRRGGKKKKNRKRH
jgi:hypothetical protein